ncbi:hypothetical protein [Streptomyces sp. NPDC005476]|uniref:hypothetical protein n=1 Tax=Streptomyces sp. NPDC005476 TaxID=3156882 RepID=UPI003456AD86
MEGRHSGGRGCGGEDRADGEEQAALSSAARSAGGSSRRPPRAGSSPRPCTAPWAGDGQAAADWHASERTLSIHTIRTRRREGCYWTVVLATVAFGTDAGDLTAGVGPGYLGSVIVFAAAICVPALAHRLGPLDAVTPFRTAFVIARPSAPPRRLDGTRPCSWGPGPGPGPRNGAGRVRMDGRNHRIRRLPRRVTGRPACPASTQPTLRARRLGAPTEP